MPSIHDLVTPALLVDAAALDHNLLTMSAALPGARLRPHVKAHKCTSLARRQAEAGHRTFCCATVREMIGMATAGLGDDLMLANETLHPERLRRTRRARHRGGGLRRDGRGRGTRRRRRARGAHRRQRRPAALRLRSRRRRPAGRSRPRRHGLAVRGVMGYEGHAVGMDERDVRTQLCEQAMALLLAAHRDVGGDVVSAGGTGTYDINTWANEIQAGSYVLDGHRLRQARAAVRAGTVGLVDGDLGIAGLRRRRLRPQVAGHGPRQSDASPAARCGSARTSTPTFGPEQPMAVGDRVRVVPAHIDPTIAYHERMYLVDGRARCSTSGRSTCAAGEGAKRAPVSP